jgi:hypothetical protein
MDSARRRTGYQPATGAEVAHERSLPSGIKSAEPLAVFPAMGGRKQIICFGRDMCFG